MESLNTSKDMSTKFEDNVSYMPASEMILWSTVFIIEAILIVFGNVLTILTFLNFRLRQNKPFFFLLNLSFADFVVGAISIPLFVHVFIYYFSGKHLEDVIYASHVSVEVFTQFIAIFSLVLVSLERMYAVVWPLKHRGTKLRTYFLCIVATWALAAAVPCLSHIPLQPLQKLSFYLYFIFHSAALVIICISYVMVWMWVSCQRPRIISRHLEFDRKLARTLVLVTVVSLIAWLPFQVIYYVLNLCVSCDTVPNTLLYFSKMMHYGNSLVNPIVYCFRIPEFYRTTLRILRLRKIPTVELNGNSIELRRRDDVNPSPLEHSIVTYRDDYPISRETCLDT